MGATTGRIVVTTPGGTASSATDFVVVAPPTISDFTPKSGRVGTVVSITGTNLAGASVKFNNKNATGVTVTGTGTTITVSVPNGARTGPITVTTAGGSAVTSSAFTLTP